MRWDKADKHVNDEDEIDHHVKKVELICINFGKGKRVGCNCASREDQPIKQ